MTVDDRICIWPACEARESTTMKLPLCDPHAVHTYRAVAAHARSVKPPKTKPLPTSPDTPRPTRARRNTRSKPGTIYFARIEDLVKIGYTTDLRGRMSSIKPHEVLATMPGTMREEEALHHRFGSHWETGEWFRMGPELMDFIAQLNAPVDAEPTHV